MKQQRPGRHEATRAFKENDFAGNRKTRPNKNHINNAFKMKVYDLRPACQDRQNKPF